MELIIYFILFANALYIVLLVDSAMDRESSAVGRLGCWLMTALLLWNTAAIAVLMWMG